LKKLIPVRPWVGGVWVGAEKVWDGRDIGVGVGWDTGVGVGCWTGSSILTNEWRNLKYYLVYQDS
jgi:hypothetical protein